LIDFILTSPVYFYDFVNKLGDNIVSESIDL